MTDVLALGTDLPTLRLTLYADVYNPFGIDVTELDGTPADLTGATAALHFDGLDLAATTDVPGSAFNWSIAPGVTAALTWNRKPASLTVTVAGQEVPWAVGTVELIRAPS